MRTTVNLDEDVLARLKDEAQLRSEPLRQTLNEVIREGLLVVAERRSKPVRFQIKARAMGLKPGLSYDSTSKLLAILDEEEER